jgi:hypothetical protein
MPYPTNPTLKIFQNCLRVTFQPFRVTKMMASVRIPKARRVTMSEKGGITFMTTLLTTYIPPQMEAALKPERIPQNGLLLLDLFSMD